MPSTTRRSQAERVEASERALIDAAVALLAERGYQRTTLAAIGDRAGYSRGLVTERFGSKEGLLWAIFERAMPLWSAQALRPRVGGRVGVEALEATIDAYLDAVDRAPHLIRAYDALLHDTDAPPAIRERITALQRDERRSIATWIRKGQQAGTVRADVDPRAEAVVFLGMIRGVTAQWLLDPKGVDLVGALTQYAADLPRTLSSCPRPAGAARQSS